jgi:hypothetical protein
VSSAPDVAIACEALTKDYGDGDGVFDLTLTFWADETEDLTASERRRENNRD